MKIGDTVYIRDVPYEFTVTEIVERPPIRRLLVKCQHCGWSEWIRQDEIRKEEQS